jgi:hypothetical protein
VPGVQLTSLRASSFRPLYLVLPTGLLANLCDPSVCFVWGSSCELTTTIQDMNCDFERKPQRLSTAFKIGFHEATDLANGSQ